MRHLLLFLILLTTTANASNEILNPTFSKRQTFATTLDNGLQALIISDPNIDQSGALLTVQAGSWDEPKEHPGIAHFLEHMLFLGTKKYPQEGEYQRFISHHNGQTNAFTASTYTAYLFSVDNNAFPEALDRFSEFFKEPLFNPSGVDRELRAIDQEYAKNLENDEFREYFVLKELSNEEHPERRFNIGSYDTLKHVSQSTLKEWHRENYSANLMRLIVYSNRPMNELKKLVSGDFSDIPTNNRKARAFNEPSIPTDLQGKMVIVEPVKNLRTLTLAWELPASVALLRNSQPEHIISYILGHEGSESLLAQLKREKLAEGLKSGAYLRGNQATALFEIEISLTDQGVSQVNKVIERTFQAIATLNDRGVSEELFNEIQQIAKINYQYQQREKLFYTLLKDGHNLPLYDLKNYPYNANVVQNYAPQDIQGILSELTPSRAVYFLRAPSNLTHVKPTATEEWMGVNYSVTPISQELLANWNSIEEGHPDINLPAPNPYVPNSLELVNQRKNGNELPLVPVPELLVDSDQGTVYYAPDYRYGVPKVSWTFDFKTPMIDASKPGKVVMADLFVKAVEEALSDDGYNADIAGLKYEITREDFSIQVKIEGYSDHADKLFATIVKELKEVNPTEQKFDLYKNALQREYQNSSRELPIRQALDTLKSIVYQSQTTPKQNLSAIRRVTYEKFNQYRSELFSELSLNALLFGNLDKTEALAVWNQAWNKLGSLPYPKDKQKKQEVIILPEQGGPYYIEQTTKSQGNSVVLAIEGDGYSFEKRAAQQVLNQALSQAFFAELRTKQQTGYIVQSWPEEIERQLFQIFAVQSSSHNVYDLLSRFELFNEQFLQELSHDVTPEVFEKIRQAVLTQLTIPQKSLSEMSNLLYTLAFKYDGRFDWLDERIKALEGLTYERFIELTRDFLRRDNHRRFAILIRGATPGESPTYQRLRNVDQLRSVSEFAIKTDVVLKSG